MPRGEWSVVGRVNYRDPRLASHTLAQGDEHLGMFKSTHATKNVNSAKVWDGHGPALKIRDRGVVSALHLGDQREPGGDQAAYRHCGEHRGDAAQAVEPAERDGSGRSPEIENGHEHRELRRRDCGRAQPHRD